MDEIVLAVDPGREKAGIAVVSRERGTMHKCVIEASECVEQVCELAEKHGVARIVIGDRTGSSEIIEALGLFATWKLSPSTSTCPLWRRGNAIFERILERESLAFCRSG